MALAPTQLTLDRNLTAATADVGWFVVQFAGGDGFKVGSFTKAPGGANTPQTIAHGLGEVPKALILWTQGRSDETFSSASGITFRGAATGTAPTGDLTLTINLPPGTAANDAMVASIAFRPSTAVITPPAGWALIRRLDNAAGSANSLAVYGKVATISEPASYTWTFNTSTGSAGGIQSFTGADLTNPFDGDNGASTASSLTHTAPGITTTSANDMIVTTHSLFERRDLDAASRHDRGVRCVIECGSRRARHVDRRELHRAGRGWRDGNQDGDRIERRRHRERPHPRDRAAPAGTAYFGFGMTDGTRSRSVSTSSQDGAPTSNASTRMANKVLTMVRWGEVVVAEADLSSWNDTTFTLNWTTNDTAATSSTTSPSEGPTSRRAWWTGRCGRPGKRDRDRRRIPA